MKFFLSPDLRKVALLSAICFIGFAFYSCKKEGNIKPNFESSASGAFVTDTLSIHVKTVKEDSISTGQSSLSLFGLYNDSIFGRSKASFYTQIRLPFNAVNVATPGNFTVDSVVLSLVYAGKFGEEAIHNLSVYELTEGLESSENYYSNDSIAHDAVSLAQVQFTSNTENDIKIAVPDQNGDIDTIEVLPQLRVKLDAALGTRILNQSPSGALANNDAFIEFFKGIYVEPTGPAPQNFNENNILYFALTHSQSKLSIFFTETSSQTKKLLDLPITNDAIRFNRYSHKYAGSSVEKALTDANDSLTTYVQSMGGVRPVLTFPELTKTFPQDEHYVINKAELILPVFFGDYFDNGIPEQLLALTSDSSGRLIFTEDLTTWSRTDGYYSAKDTSYHFNVTRYIDGIVNDGRTERGLTFIPNGSVINAQRLILNGPDKEKRKMKLKLYYSKLD